MSDNLLRDILREYDEYRLNEEQALKERESEVMRSIPEFACFRNAFVSTLAKKARLLIQNSNESELPEHNMDTYRQREVTLLKQHGYPIDYLIPRFRCTLCKDTGFTGELVRERCNCLVQQLIERTYRLSDITGLEKENFDTFDADVFPNVPLRAGSMTQREYMQQLKTVLAEYQSAYPDNPKKNMLFTGKTGLGKTFLLNCLAKSILDKGHTVLKVTSYNLFEHLFRNAIHNSEESHMLKDRIFRVDTLIIDDLGTETKRNNFTAEELFNILNERYLQRQHTFLSTNLTLADLKECYSDRVTSRLFDTQNTMIIRFSGQDIRLKQKNPST